MGFEAPAGGYKIDLTEAQKIISGEFSSGGDEEFARLQKYLAQSEQSGTDISAQKPEIEAILKEIPIADLNNALKKTQSFFESGNNETAEDWLREFRERLRKWRRQGTIDIAISEEFAQKGSDLESKFKKRLF